MTVVAFAVSHLSAKLPVLTTGTRPKWGGSNQLQVSIIICVVQGRKFKLIEANLREYLFVVFNHRKGYVKLGNKFHSPSGFVNKCHWYSDLEAQSIFIELGRLFR